MNSVSLSSLISIKGVAGKAGRSAKFDRRQDKPIEEINADISRVAMALDANGISYELKTAESSGKNFILLSDSVAVEEVYLENGQYGSENKLCVLVGGYTRPAAHYKCDRASAIVSWVQTHTHIIHPVKTEVPA